METAPILTRLWDYGWLCRDRLKLPEAASDADLIEQYVASPAFHTSFLPNDKDETGIHGPFVAERITAADFVPLHQVELGPYLESVEFRIPWARTRRSAPRCRPTCEPRSREVAGAMC
jgi:hypothetical protein